MLDAIEALGFFELAACKITSKSLTTMHPQDESFTESRHYEVETLSHMAGRDRAATEKFL